MIEDSRMKSVEAMETVDFSLIAEIVGGKADQVREAYEKWHAAKRGTKNADVKLLAMLSGLSTAAISYYINDKKGSISAEKAEMLRQLLECLHYTPLAAARKLRSREKKSIAFISPLSESPGQAFSLEILRAVKGEAKKYGYFVDVFDVEESEEQSFFSSVPFLGMVDGVILSSLCTDSGMLAPLAEHRLPVVDVHSWKNLEQLPVTDSISPKNEVFEQLLDHLFGELGYVNPVLVSLPPKDNITRKRKLEMYIQSFERYGIPFDPNRNVVYVNRHSVFEAKRVYPEIFKANAAVDAIVCLSDTVAVAISVELAAEGRKIAVSGYDNLDISDLFNITTIDQNLGETGRIAFEKLYFAIKYMQENGTYPPHSDTAIDLRFIKRSSTMRK